MPKIERLKYPRPRARKIPLAEVKEFLEEKGYTVVKLWQPWRHVVGIVKKGNDKAFFKLGTTLKISKMTENEFLWNDLVGNNLDTNAPFVVPQGFEKGLYKERLFYYMSDYYEGDTLADKKPPSTKNLAIWIPKIARAAYLIDNISIPEQYKSPKNSAGIRLFDSASEWGSQLSSDVSLLLEIIESSKRHIRVALNHGDFVPWHMHDLGSGRFALVDAEHGGPRPKYYDVAYFYTRVRQSLGEGELARKFLLEFKGLLPDKDKEVFWKELKPVLAQRLVGNFWEVETSHEVGSDIDLKRCEEFKKDLVGDKII